jgi:hypothetical protein
MEEIRFEQECNKCGGTGLYSGMAEGKGFAVECYACKGSGKYEFVHQYNKFTGRKKPVDVDYVLQANPGIMVGGVREGRFPEGYFGGVSYQEWERGSVQWHGKEMRNSTCPAWFYQSADYKKKPDWKECIVCGTFSGCKNFPNKHKCWERFDSEQRTAKVD